MRGVPEESQRPVIIIIFYRQRLCGTSGKIAHGKESRKMLSQTPTYVVWRFSLVVVGSEIGRLAEVARGPNSYLTPSLSFHTPLLGG